MTLPFKLQQASPEGGSLATTLTYIHHPSESAPITINVIFYVNGNISNQQTSFLLDSGAAISVVHHKLLPNHISISGPTTAAVSATGAPLDMAGRATLSVSLGTFVTRFVKRYLFHT